VNDILVIMGSDTAPNDSISRGVADNDLTIEKNLPSNVTNIEDIKGVGEDVQYQIAQAQSPLSATSKASWKLCKYALYPAIPMTALI
jgi:hypothetical protein